jgi:hypothetical protein
MCGTGIFGSCGSASDGFWFGAGVAYLGCFDVFAFESFLGFSFHVADAWGRVGPPCNPRKSV